MFKKHLPIFLVLLVTAIFLLAADSPPPAQASEALQAELTAAFTDRLQTSANLDSLTFDLFTPELDTAFTSSDGQTAVLWLALRDDSGRKLANEPGLAVAQRTEKDWQVMLPGDPEWEQTLAGLPEGMLPLELSPIPESIEVDTTARLDALTGYYLPFAAGTTRWLEGSISHFQSIPELGYPSCGIDTCRYAYDFTDEWHFPLVASKEGAVFSSRDSCSDGDPYCTNYIVLYNAGDQAYQIYLHLAQGTIPNKLTQGTYVQRGQYLGDSDDTGYSTSQHVHFMVTDSIWLGGNYEKYYWGTSIDIRFADVAINSGIPRTCYEVTKFQIYDGATECLGDRLNPRDPANDWFTSGNIGAFPPTGTISRPAAGATVTSGNSTSIDVTATTDDDVRVTGVSLVANLDGEWTQIGPKVTQAAQTNLYDWDVDLCASGPFNGFLEIALRVWDHEGNVSDALDPRTIQVDHACLPPSSQLTAVDSFNSTAALVHWNATDAGAGLDWFELQWRTELGTWNASNSFTLPGDFRSAWFAGQPGTTYAFRLRAVDINGQAEDWPQNGGAELSVTLPGSCSPDAYEQDDTAAQARNIALGASVSRNLCGPADPDWFRVDISKSANYYVSARSLQGGAAVRLIVYKDDGTTVAAEAAAGWVGQHASLRLLNLAPGKYFIKVEPLLDFLSGTDAVYGLTIFESREVFLPLVGH